MAGREHVRLQVLAGGVGLITLDRPEKRNAVDLAMSEALSGLVQAAERDESIRAVVLASSHQSVFCAGADLNVVAQGPGQGLVSEHGFAGFTRAPRAKPWVAAVDGWALAGGCELALACDLIVASPEARFGLPEVRLGLLAAEGGVARLAQRVPLAAALSPILTGEPLDAARAYQLGLVSRLVPRGEVLGAAVDLAARIAANAPLAVRASLRLARVAAGAEDAAVDLAAAELSAAVLASADAQQGARAFLEKRAPIWTGR